METGDMLDRLGSDLLDVLVEYCDWRSSLALSASSATLRASTTTVDPLGPLLRVAHTNSRALCYWRVVKTRVASVTLDSLQSRRASRTHARAPLCMRNAPALPSCRTLLWRVSSDIEHPLHASYTSEAPVIVDGLQARLIFLPAGTRLSTRDGHCAIFLETLSRRATLQASPPPPLVFRLTFARAGGGRSRSRVFAWTGGEGALEPGAVTAFDHNGDALVARRWGKTDFAALEDDDSDFEEVADDADDGSDDAADDADHEGALLRLDVLECPARLEMTSPAPPREDGAKETVVTRARWRVGGFAAKAAFCAPRDCDARTARLRAGRAPPPPPRRWCTRDHDALLSERCCAARGDAGVRVALFPHGCDCAARGWLALFLRCDDDPAACAAASADAWRVELVVGERGRWRGVVPRGAFAAGSEFVGIRELALRADVERCARREGVDEVAVLISRHVDEPGEVPGEVGPPVHHEAAWSAHRGGWVDSDVGWVIPPGAAVV